MASSFAETDSLSKAHGQSSYGTTFMGTVCSETHYIVPDSYEISPQFVLSPYAPLQRISSTFSVCRVSLVIILLTVVLVGCMTLKEDTFRVWMNVSKGTKMTFEECTAQCLRETRSCHAEVVRINVGKGGYTSASGNNRGDCEVKKQQPLWKGLVTVSVMVLAIVLVIQGLPGEVLLLGGACFLSLIGVLDSHLVFKGFNSSGVLGLAVLFALSDAVSETGILEQAMGLVLGNPKSLNAALLRMMFPMASLSAFLSNTATVALMIPVLCTWSRRLDVHPGKLLMPLSFASQLGGCLTLIGSSHCLVAADVTKAAYPGNEGKGMGMFDLFPIGFILMVGTSLAIAVLANTPLLSSSADADGSSSSCCTDAEIADSTEVYKVQMVVQQQGGFAGKTLADTGVARLKGIHRVDCAAAMSRPSERLEVDDVIDFWCVETGLVALRASPGLAHSNSCDLQSLGGRRRSRFLYEVAVRDGSPFLISDILKTPERLAEEFGAVFIAGPKAPLHNRELPVLQVGSLLLCEANEDWVREHSKESWSSACTLILKIPNSSPLRIGGPVDGLRNAAVCGGMLVLIGAASFAGIQLHVAGVVILLMYLLIRATTVRKMFGAMKVDILFIIAGAMAMGEALTATGVVNAIADSLMTAAQPLGKYAVLVTMYVVAVFLSMFINNSATVAILGPMLVAVVEMDPSYSMKGLAWLLTCAAGTCFTTPLGYQTNLMVMPAGGYSFGDFVKFGVPLQLIHMLLCVLSIGMLEDVLPPQQVTG